MLSGQIMGKISQKFQTAFPRQFRQEMGEHLIITKSIDQCLLVVGQDKWETLLEGTGGKPFTDKATREMQRYLFGNAFSVTLDTQGRFVFPEYLRSYAKMTKEIVFVGVQRYVEIWDKTLWERHSESIAGSIDLLTVDLSKTHGHE
jgi:MraZ protein